MKSLQLSDYKGIIQYLGFERKMMNDIEFVCTDGYNKSKHTYIKKRVRKYSKNQRGAEESKVIYAQSHKKT